MPSAFTRRFCRPKREPRSREARRRAAQASPASPSTSRRRQADPKVRQDRSPTHRARVLTLEMAGMASPLRSSLPTSTARSPLGMAPRLSRHLPRRPSRARASPGSPSIRPTRGCSPPTISGAGCIDVFNRSFNLESLGAGAFMTPTSARPDFGRGKRPCTGHLRKDRSLRDGGRCDPDRTSRT